MTTTSVTSGQTLSSGTVTSGNSKLVLSGGITSGLIVLGGGTEFVSSGGIARTTALRGGTETVSAGGATSATTISSGLLVNTGIATGTVILAGGGFTNTGGGTASFTTISSGGVFNESGTDTGTIISSGGSASVAGSTAGTSVLQGGTLTIQAGGTALGATVSGADTVNSGGTASGSVVSGAETVLAGGQSIRATVTGNENVAGIATSATVLANATETVSSGGQAIGTVLSGGTLNILSGGSASNTAVASGGLEKVTGHATGDVIGNGGSGVVEVGGVDATPTIAGGTLEIVDGGAVSGAITFAGTSGRLLIDSQTMPVNVISEFAQSDLIDLTGVTYDASDSYSVVGDQLTVSAGGSSYVLNVAGASSDAFVLIDDGGQLDVGLSVPLAAGTTSSGGTVAPGEALAVFGTTSGFTVASGGSEQIKSGGVGDSTIVPSGGILVISSGGTANETSVANGGTETVLSGGAANRTITFGTEDNRGTTISATISSGGVETVAVGATAISTTVTVGGFEDTFGTTTNEVVGSGGSAFIEAGGAAIDPTIDGGTLELAPGSVVAGAINFTGTGGTLQIDDTVMPSTTISGYTTGDSIDLRGVTFSSGGSVSLSGNTLTVTENGISSTLQVAGNFAGQFFHLSSDGNGGSSITADGTPCYCRGTLILTDTGEVAVEDLQIGDRLITKAGDAKPLQWIGRRSYSGRFIAGNRDVLPVLIKQGALSDNVPRRDLLVSPLHAMFLDDVLIPALALVNEVSILQAETVETVEYFHLELEAHDVIHAEGALSETFVDDDSRGMFHNVAEHHTLYPHSARTPARYCAPRVEDGEELEVVRHRLAARIQPLVTEATQALAGRLRSNLETVQRGHLGGWAHDDAAPDSPVLLRILDNGVTIGQVLANTHRNDLEQAGIGGGNRSFAMVVLGGLSPDRRHVIQVQRTSDGRDLRGSPWVLEAAVEPLRHAG